MRPAPIVTGDVMLVAGRLEVAGFEYLSADPTTGLFPGRVYINSNTGTVKVYSGSEWNDLGNSWDADLGDNGPSSVYTAGNLTISSPVVCNDMFVNGDLIIEDDLQVKGNLYIVGGRIKNISSNLNARLRVGGTIRQYDAASSGVNMLWDFYTGYDIEIGSGYVGWCLEDTNPATIRSLGTSKRKIRCGGEFVMKKIGTEGSPGLLLLTQAGSQPLDIEVTGNLYGALRSDPGGGSWQGTSVFIGGNHTAVVGNTMEGMVIDYVTSCGSIYVGGKVTAIFQPWRVAGSTSVISNLGSIKVDGDFDVGYVQLLPGHDNTGGGDFGLVIFGGNVRINDESEFRNSGNNQADLFVLGDFKGYGYFGPSGFFPSYTTAVKGVNLHISGNSKPNGALNLSGSNGGTGGSYEVSGSHVPDSTGSVVNTGGGSSANGNGGAANQILIKGDLSGGVFIANGGAATGATGNGGSGGAINVYGKVSDCDLSSYGGASKEYAAGNGGAINLFSGGECRTLSIVGGNTTGTTEANRKVGGASILKFNGILTVGTLTCKAGTGSNDLAANAVAGIGKYNTNLDAVLYAKTIIITGANYDRTAVKGNGGGITGIDLTEIQCDTMSVVAGSGTLDGGAVGNITVERSLIAAGGVGVTALTVKGGDKTYASGVGTEKGGNVGNITIGDRLVCNGSVTITGGDAPDVASLYNGGNVGVLTCNEVTIGRYNDSTVVFRMAGGTGGLLGGSGGEIRALNFKCYGKVTSGSQSTTKVGPPVKFVMGGELVIRHLVIDPVGGANADTVYMMHGMSTRIWEWNVKKFNDFRNQINTVGWPDGDIGTGCELWVNAKVTGSVGFAAAGTANKLPNEITNGAWSQGMAYGYMSGGAGYWKYSLVNNT